MNTLGQRMEDYMLANGAWPTIAQARTFAAMTTTAANTARDQLVAAGEAHVGPNGRIRIRPPARTRWV